MLEGYIKQLKEDAENLKKKEKLTPVKSIKTPRNSLWSMSKMRLFESVSVPEMETNDNSQTLTEVDYDALLDDLETKISVLKKENTEFIVFIDELNDSSYSSEKQNSFLKSGLKTIDKQMSELVKRRSLLKKEFDKHFPSSPDLDNLGQLDLNMKYLEKACQSNLSSDIISFLNQ